MKRDNKYVLFEERMAWGREQALGLQKRCLNWVLTLKYFSHSHSVLFVSLILLYWLSSCDTDGFGETKIDKNIISYWLFNLKFTHAL